MRFVFILFLFFINLFGGDLNGLVKQINKNSPDYTLDLTLVKKIKELNYNNPVLDLNISNQNEYLSLFFKLVDLKKEYNNLPSIIKETNKKIDILSSDNDITSKLQTLYYQKLLDIYNKKYDYLDKNFQNIEKKVYQKLFDIKFDTNLAKSNIDYWNKLLSDKQKELEKLKINLQKWQILNNEKNIENMQNLININIQKQKNIYKNLLKNYLILFFDELKNKDKTAFKTAQSIDYYANKLDLNESGEIINDFETFRFGAKAIIYNSKKELKHTLEKLISLIKYPLFKIGNNFITPLDLILFIFILFIGWFIGKYYKKLIYSLRKKYEISYSSATLLANIGYYTIIFLSFIFSLKIVGLDLSSLAIIAGALSVGIGFGLQNIVSNFVSGIILMFEKTIKVDDYIEIDENTRGKVMDISMRSTIIRTNDNIDLIIPNQDFIQNKVINWTLGDEIVRFRIPFGVAYGNNIEKVEKIILDAIEKSNLPFLRKEQYKPLVVFIEMADSSLNFELFVWVKGEYAMMPRRTRSKFLKVIYNALNEAGITIPFPQQDLHIKDTVPFEIKIKKD
ncbi:MULTISPECIES: mechanosensitive ion channel family protein [unclassified Lebetimonas]|uniref:mechanosensitive ion channel family protein n=1 Tax=unclassified Lebetimonas TaxID=2648158 RepID=UPI000467ACE1|nr:MULTISPECIES: mechanosensitive ion channel domain-containing protein [unclassified Lebetimonas]